MNARAVSDRGDADWKLRVEELEDLSRRAFLSRDIDLLTGLWSDELVVNSPINRALDRSQIFDLLERGVIAHASFDVHIETMRRLGDIVVVMGHDVVSDTPDSPPVHRRFTNVWRAVGDSWQMIARHANVMGSPPPGAPQGAGLADRVVRTRGGAVS